jgi:hypothetical protein
VGGGGGPYPDNNGNDDPAKAVALLKQAGYPHGVSIKLLYSTLAPMPQLAQSLQSSLSAGAFHVSLVPVPQVVFFGNERRSSLPEDPGGDRPSEQRPSEPAFPRGFHAEEPIVSILRLYPPDLRSPSRVMMMMTSGRLVRTRDPHLCKSGARCWSRSLSSAELPISRRFSTTRYTSFFPFLFPEGSHRGPMHRAFWLCRKGLTGAGPATPITPPLCIRAIVRFVARRT